MAPTKHSGVNTILASTKIWHQQNIDVNKTLASTKYWRRQNIDVDKDWRSQNIGTCVEAYPYCFGPAKSAAADMKVDSDVLLLSYLDKICLILTGDLRGALACLHVSSEVRLYKGAREATLPPSTTLHSTGNISV